MPASITRCNAYGLTETQVVRQGDIPRLSAAAAPASQPARQAGRQEGTCTTTPCKQRCARGIQQPTNLCARNPPTQRFGPNSKALLPTTSAQCRRTHCQEFQYMYRDNNQLLAHTDLSIRYCTSSRTVSAVRPGYGSMCTPQNMSPARSTAAITFAMVWSV